MRAQTTDYRTAGASNANVSSGRLSAIFGSRDLPVDSKRRIVRKLKEKTSATIALISLPVLGEDLGSISNQRVEEYNAILKDITEREQVSYLPVYERQEEYLREVQQSSGRRYQSGGMLSIKALARHFLLRQSFDEISRKNHFLLLTDGIHMNTLGATFIAEIESFLRSYV